MILNQVNLLKPLTELIIPVQGVVKLPKIPSLGTQVCMEQSGAETQKSLRSHFTVAKRNPWRVLPSGVCDLHTPCSVPGFFLSPIISGAGFGLNSHFMNPELCCDPEERMFHRSRGDVPQILGKGCSIDPREGDVPQIQRRRYSMALPSCGLIPQVSVAAEGRHTQIPNGQGAVPLSDGSSAGLEHPYPEPARGKDFCVDFYEHRKS